MKKTQGIRSLRARVGAFAAFGPSCALILALALAGCMEVKQKIGPDVPGLNTTVDLVHSSVDASSATISADGVTTVTLTVTLVNADGTPIPGRRVALSSSRPSDDAISTASGPSDAFGQVTFRVASAVVGTSTFSATDSSAGVALLDSAIVSFSTSAISADNSILAASDVSLAVAGTSTLELEARDALGNLIGAGGSSIAFTLSDPSVGTLTAVTDQGDGTYTAVFTATQVGSTDVTATIDGSATVTTVVTIDVL